MDKLKIENLDLYYEKFHALKSIDPVSYTHLDVYKRQLGAGDAFHLVPRAIALCTTGLENYTACLLYTSSKKRAAWEDLQSLRQRLIELSIYPDLLKEDRP